MEKITEGKVSLPESKIFVDLERSTVTISQDHQDVTLSVDHVDSLVEALMMIKGLHSGLYPQIVSEVRPSEGWVNDYGNA
jgi:hypothetical protein